MRPPSALDEVILEVVRTIPAGALASYADVSEVVEELGVTCTPRSVARALSVHGDQPGVAWWRVVQAAGTVAEPVAVAAARELRAEGVQVTGRRVPLEARRWAPAAIDLAGIAERLDPGGSEESVRP